tara:strand:- start:4476 stop:4727 length:252 start_codon:yes stop_codon:yes gene_type:complete
MADRATTLTRAGAVILMNKLQILGGPSVVDHGVQRGVTLTIDDGEEVSVTVTLLEALKMLHVTFNGHFPPVLLAYAKKLQGDS